MAQYVDTKTAYGGQVRKVVLLHMIPAEQPGQFLVSVDLLEHLVHDGGLIRARRGPRVTRKVVLEAMSDDEARAAAERIGRENGTPYVAIVRDSWLWADQPAPARIHHDAAD
jgi:hypothetical protein